MMNSVQFRRYDRNGLARDRGKPIRATIVTDAHLRFREMMVRPVTRGARHLEVHTAGIELSQ